MNNTIYKNCTVDDFRISKHRLERVESQIDYYLANHAPEFYIDRMRDWEESLGINLRSRAFPLKVNIAIVYQDHPGPQTYFMGILKSIDKDNRRYFKRRKIIENASLEMIEEKIEELLQIAVNESNSWTENDLTESIEIGQVYYSKEGKGLKRYYPP